MGTYPATINKELNRYLPFLATTQILSLALKQGIGREKAHSIIKKHAISEALKMREEGSSENNLVMLLAEDTMFKEAGITEKELSAVLGDQIHFVGNAQRQIDAVKKKTASFLKKYAQQASYEPSDIL
jgi:adenylosuccinate lyase